MGNGHRKPDGTVICGLATLLAGCAAIPAPDIVSEGLLLDHVNVVDVSSSCGQAATIAPRHRGGACIIAVRAASRYSDGQQLS